MSLLFSPTNWANPGAIGSTTPSTGAFTTLISNALQIPGVTGSPFTGGSEGRIYNSSTSFAQAPVNNSLGWLIFQSRPNADSRGFCWIGGQTQASIAALHDNGGLQIGSANISSTSPGAGSLRVTAATIAGTTASTSTTTGALTVSGGAGIAGALNVGSTITGSQFRLSALNTAPTSANDTGVLGEVRIDANFIYVCTATNTWKRAAISTW